MTADEVQALARLAADTVVPRAGRLGRLADGAAWPLRLLGRTHVLVELFLERCGGLPDLLDPVQRVAGAHPLGPVVLLDDHR